MFEFKYAIVYFNEFLEQLKKKNKTFTIYTHSNLSCSPLVENNWFT